MKKIISLLLIFYCLIIYSCGNAGTTAVAEKKSAGQLNYENNCTNCHGSDGKLGALGAKDLSVSVLSKEQMIDIITNGKSTMTPFVSVMSKEEISLVADYIQILKK